MHIAGSIGWVRFLTLVFFVALLSTKQHACRSGEREHSVTLKWNHSDANGFNVYRSGVSGGPYSPIGTSSSPEYVDKNVLAGTQYCYVVTAVKNGVESAYSQEICAKVPTP